MSAACARMLGVETIYMIDHNDYRLEFAQRTYGAIPINFDKVLIISHCMPLKDAVKGYEIFDECEDDCRKVVPTP